MSKYRISFVTNSSSSSFTCQLCGYTASGMDMTMREAEMVRCENGHIFCETAVDLSNITDEQKLERLLSSHRSNIEHYGKYAKEYPESEFYSRRLEISIRELEKLLESGYDESMEEEYKEIIQEDGISASLCPICSFEKFVDRDMVKFLFKKLGVAPEEVLSELKNTFGSYREFKDFIK